MVHKKEQGSSQLLDGIKWSIFILLLLGASYANYYYGQVAMPIRLVIGIVGFILLVFIALQTTQGRRFAGYTKDTRMELRKVVWPSRQETVQTTLLVIVMVIITGLILWGIDSFLMWAITWLTGQRG